MKNGAAVKTLVSKSIKLGGEYVGARVDAHGRTRVNINGGLRGYDVCQLWIAAGYDVGDTLVHGCYEFFKW